MTVDLGIRGGEWVTIRGGIKVWHPIKGVELAPLGAQVDLSDLTPPDTVYPPRVVVDVHELRACLTCPARVDECCRTTSGAWTEAHAGRLVSRRCSCGALITGYGNARMCAACAYESHKTSQRESARRRRAA